MTAILTVDTDQLKRAVMWARPDPGNPVPVLANVRVLIAGTQVVVACGDWETCKIGRAPGTGEGGQDGVLVPWDQLISAVRVHDGRKRTEVRIGDGQVDLVASNQRAGVAQTADPAAYPALPKVPQPTGWADAAVLAPALAAAARCCSAERTLPAICCVHFIHADAFVDLEATDRYVLGLHQIPVGAAGTPGGGWLIPGPLVTAFAAACDDEGPVCLAAPSGTGMAMLSSTWHTLLTKSPDLEYPKVRTLVDRDAETRAEFTCDAAALAGALAEAAVLSGQACKAKLEALLADTGDTRKERDKKAWVAERAGNGVFVDAGPGGAEVVCADPFTRAELGRWTVTEDPAVGDAVVQLNPWHLTRLLPADPAGTEPAEPGAEVTVVLSKPSSPARVTWGDSPWEGIIMPVRTEVFPDRKLNNREEATV